MITETLFDGINNVMRFTINELPATKEQMDGLFQVAQAIKDEPEYLVQIVLANHDDPKEFHFGWQRDGYRLILVFPVGEFDGTWPLLLSGEHLSFHDLWEILEGVCQNGCGADSFPVIDTFHNVTDDVFGETIVDESVNQENREYSEKLNELINAYSEDRTNNKKHNMVFRHIYEGREKDLSLPVVLNVDAENKKEEPFFFEFQDKTKALFVYVNAHKDSSHPAFRWISFREMTSICDEKKNCEGLLIVSDIQNAIHFPLELLHRDPKRAIWFLEEHLCPVCGKTMFPQHGSFETCPVCGWEDDECQERYPEEDGGANGASLNEYKRRYESGWRPEWLKNIQDE